jgi:hypothetical protein
MIAAGTTEVANMSERLQSVPCRSSRFPSALRSNRPPHLSNIGQLIVVVADARRPDHGDTVAIRRPGVTFDAQRSTASRPKATGWWPNGRATPRL